MKLGSHVVVKKNPNFVGKAAEIEKIIVKLIPNTQTIEAALLSGEVDMVGEVGVSFDQAVEFEKRMAKDTANKDRFKTIFRDGLIYEHIDLNLRNPILADLNVELHYLATWWDVLAVVKKGGYLQAAQIDEVEKFLHEPAKWSAAHGGVASFPSS